MPYLEKPSPENSYAKTHAALLVSSYKRFTGKDLLPDEIASGDIPRVLFEAHFGLVSHNTDSVPVFNYGNQTALTAFELEWKSLYTFQCRSIERYRHGRVLFAGDAAHLVPILGVRGLTSGIDDAGNLAWKLAAVIQGIGGDRLLDSYSEERVFAAHENISQARKSTLFMTPPSRGHTLMRDAALSLAVAHEFARPLVNPRQTTAIVFPTSIINTPDTLGGDRPPVGATLPTCPVEWRDGNRTQACHLLDHVRLRPTIVQFGDHRAALAEASSGHAVDVVTLLDRPDPAFDGPCLIDNWQRARAVLGASGPDEGILVRPDGHIAARWTSPDVGFIRDALRRALGLEAST